MVSRLSNSGEIRPAWDRNFHPKLPLVDPPLTVLDAGGDTRKMALLNFTWFAQHEG